MSQLEGLTLNSISRRYSGPILIGKSPNCSEKRGAAPHKIKKWVQWVPAPEKGLQNRPKNSVKLGKKKGEKGEKRKTTYV